MAKHLAYNDRLEIERHLKLGFSLSAISKELNRHTTTISKEVTLRTAILKKGCYGCNYNACIHRYGCDLVKLCIRTVARQGAKININIVDSVTIVMIIANTSRRRFVKS